MIRATVAIVAGTALGGCLPEGAPPWQVDHPIVAAIRVDIEERGPYGPVSPRPDRRVAAAMPGDKIRISPFLVGPDGPLDLEAAAPAWFYCQATRCFDEVAQPEALRDCATEPLGPETACRIGTGASATLQLGDLTSLALFGDPPAVYMVSGTPGGASTQRCVDRLRDLADTTETLTDCLLIIEPLPIWSVLAAAGGRRLPRPPGRAAAVDDPDRGHERPAEPVPGGASVRADDRRGGRSHSGTKWPSRAAR